MQRRLLLWSIPNDYRAAGQALDSATHWVCAAGLSFLFPIAMEHFEPGRLFGFFTFMMVLQLNRRTP